MLVDSIAGYRMLQEIQKFYIGHIEFCRMQRSS